MPPSPRGGSRRLVLATRGSRLALRQAETVADLVRRHRPDVTVEIVVVKTRGDSDERPFSSIGGKGLFVAEVERAVVEGEADIAVHSAKDLTTQLAPGCAIVCVPRRASPADVVVGGSRGSGEDRLGTLPAGGRVGTSSMRRRALLAEARPDLEPVEFRGNLDTRLDKVARGEVDAAVLALAGLERLPGAEADFGLLRAEWWLPAPGQGALAVEARADDKDVAALFEGLSDPPTWVELVAERAFARRMEGGCSVPLGCLGRASDGQLHVSGFVGDPGGGYAIRDRISGPAGAGAELGDELAQAMLAGGGAEIIAGLTRVEVPEPP